MASKTDQTFARTGVQQNQPEDKDPEALGAPPPLRYVARSGPRILPPFEALRDCEGRTDVWTPFGFGAAAPLLPIGKQLTSKDGKGTADF